MDKEPVFPSFRRQNKWLGIIDYKSLIVFCLYIYGIYQVCSGLGLSTKVVAAAVLISTIPLIAIYFVSIREESIIDIVFVVLKFYFSKKTYYYKIDRKGEFDIDLKKKNRNNIDIDKLLKWLKI